MATCLTSSSSSSWVLYQKSRTDNTFKRVVSCSLSFPSSTSFDYPKISCLVSISNSVASGSSYSSCSESVGPNKRARVFGLPVVDEENVVAEEIYGKEDIESDDNVSSQEMKKQSRPCELYVCNLPRSCDIAELVEMFKPFGTVLSAEVSRDAETGISRGCGYVTMSSINSAKVAIAALDGTDLGGREMRVRFSVEMNLTKRNIASLNSSPRKNIIYESPYKLYVGNLAWNVKPGDLRDFFSQFGTVVSAKVLHDRRAGKTRVYGFLSFSSPAERDASISLNRTEFRGRTLVVREGLERAGEP